MANTPPRSSPMKALRRDREAEKEATHARRQIEAVQGRLAEKENSLCCDRSIAVLEAEIAKRLERSSGTVAALDGRISKLDQQLRAEARPPPFGEHGTPAACFVVVQNIFLSRRVAFDAGSAELPINAPPLLEKVAHMDLTNMTVDVTVTNSEEAEKMSKALPNSLIGYFIQRDEPCTFRYSCSHDIAERPPKRGEPVGLSCG